MSAILVGLFPIDVVHVHCRLPVLTCQDQNAIRIGCLTLRVAPDATDLAMGRKRVLDELKELQVRFLPDMFPG
jgi:hypothetical protein